MLDTVYVEWRSAIITLGFSIYWKPISCFKAAQFDNQTGAQSVPPREIWVRMLQKEEFPVVPSE